MSEMWVDSDMGFDDIWALLVLQAHGVRIAGLSLVAGNALLDRVITNAHGATRAYGLDCACYAGASMPLVRAQETAQRVLGPTGMRSRGRGLAPPADAPEMPDALTGLQAWLSSTRAVGERTVIALGPLTNIAHLVTQAPGAAARITRLVWMGGSRGAGNHSAMAEFNALADPEAVAIVLDAGLPMDVVDLTLCRSVTFAEQDMPDCDPLTADLLGGYLDIALDRGRSRMAIYDPVAAWAAAAPGLFAFEPMSMVISTVPDDSYGATRFSPDPGAPTRLAMSAPPDLHTRCLSALDRENAHVH